MNQFKYCKILTLGSGPSGCTNIIYLSRANLNPILITGNQIGGQLITTSEIENWPGVAKNISGLDLMNIIFSQVKNLNIEILYDEIYKSNLLIKPINLFGKKYKYICDVLIVSTGTVSKYLSIINEKKYIGNGISFCAVCDGNFYKNKIIVILGGGDTAIENAIYLSNLVKKIVLIHRKNIFNAENIMLVKFFKKKLEKNIFIRFNTIIIDIIGDDFYIKYIKLKNIINYNINIIYTEGIFLSIGNIPSTAIFLGQLITFNKYIYVKSNKFYNYTASSISGVFASGDVQDFIYRQAITSSGSGCISAFDSIYYYNKLII